ncbi:MAG: HK97 family phage prohead protease [Rickettsiales bacterium]|nr:HK97 family phage prohead protease [Rickettsiales bacterium]
MHYEKKISANMRERKRLGFNLHIKSLDNTGRFAGYASVFDMVDSQRDMMLRGAFMATVKNRVQDIKLLWQHQQDEPIGVFEAVFEDMHGLYVEGRLLLDVARAKEAYTLLKSGAISGMSIGYSPVRYRIDAETGVRKLAEVDLWEISLVTFPANAAANVTVVKQANDLDLLVAALSKAENSLRQFL